MIGIMSGSSLDGLDICLATFSNEPDGWKFQIIKSVTVDLPDSMTLRLRNSPNLKQDELDLLDVDYGNWIGHCVFDFCSDITLKPDLIAVHGHTVFHDPAKGISWQLGKGENIANICQLPVIDNFRIDDIKKGGQGAPLVPVGELHLFNGFDGFVNLGGIANVSIINQNQIRAWDICPCNQVLNFLASKKGFAYDSSGLIARSGNFDSSWYATLKQLEYFAQKPPKSLSNQWGLENIVKKITLSAEDGLHSYTNFIAEIICQDIVNNTKSGAHIMFTGGGAFNEYLMESIREKAEGRFEIFIPEPAIIAFKEALIFGFLGLLRNLNQENVYATVTGAHQNSIAGRISLPKINKDI